MARKRSFNTEGPCNPQDHYMIDALRDMDKEILSLVEEKKFFVIHAARQSGKTTLLQALAAKINSEGNYCALYCSLENIDRMADVEIGIPAIIAMLKSSLKQYGLPNASSFADGADITALYAQHTTETGQVFLEGAVDLVWEQSQGQPWLVNALARVAVKEITAGSTLTPVTEEMILKAIHMLILQWDTHFDSLMARLREERVRRVIEPVLIGQESALARNSDDYSYVKDMGLIRDDRGLIEPANPIYGEIIVRTLSRDTQEEIGLRGNAYPIPRYLKGDTVDMNVLLADFQVFWRENEAIWRHKYDYQEAAPQLILQAFLQRVVNGGGRINREMAAGTGRTDLCVVYRELKYPIELKIRYGNGTYSEGVEQIARYMEKLGCTEGWLVLFDRRSEQSWEDKLFVKQERINDKTVIVFGC